ncbi:hypothetical protein AT268_16375 [Bacillus cereus]|uniref:Uncharacterized protein n=1 Tax=Bacillus cereus TaxID=1396 RepID=A0A9X0MFP9_BACCE|nr:hypothetical protein [Bacillus cereus]KXY31114.1 hypothetical protein AT268_16375 [Bacillus cereus]
MAIPYIDINNVLQKWAANDPPIEGFTVENVLASVHLPISKYEEVVDYLMRKRGYELIPLKMLLCPKNHKGPVFELDQPIDDEEIFECFCGEDYYYEPEKVLLVFNFTEDFKKEALKKKTISQERMLTLV